MKVSLSKAAELIRKYLAVGIVPFMVGSPAIGKSSVVHEIADSAGLILIDYRLSERDPTDISGFPVTEKGRSYYAPPRNLPLEGDALPEGKNGWLLFLDEFSNAPPAVQNVAYKLVLDRMVGDFKLHPNVHIVAAGNKATDGANVEEMSSALVSRMAVFDVEVLAEDWAQYASSVDADHRILGFINWRPTYLYTFNPDSAQDVYASPRTWMFANRLTNGKPLSDEDVLLLAPLISEGVAREFLVFTSIYKSLPSIQAIIANPLSVDVPTALDIRWATLSSIAAHASEENIGSLLKYVNRFPGELRVICLKQTIKRKPELFEHPDVEKWFEDNADELL